MIKKGYYFLPPGGIYISSEPTQIHTVLGSCVSICIWDPVNLIGGMNHYLYHHAMSNPRSARYGDVAIPHLLSLLMQAGGDLANCTAHIVGGSQGLILGSIVGEENIRLAFRLLKQHQIKLGTVDVGQTGFRKVVFHNISGEIEIKRGETQRYV